MEDSLEDFTAVFRVLQLFILFLAVLIAYNATSINADERARERATLFAFGLRVRRVVALETAEGLLIGLLGTAVGVGAGTLVVRWIVTSTLRTTMPEMGLDVVVSPGTVLAAVGLAVLAVAIAPLLTSDACAAWTSRAPSGSSSSGGLARTAGQRRSASLERSTRPR